MRVLVVLLLIGLAAPAAGRRITLKTSQGTFLVRPDELVTRVPIAWPLRVSYWDQGQRKTRTGMALVITKDTLSLNGIDLPTQGTDSLRLLRIEVSPTPRVDANFRPFHGGATTSDVLPAIRRIFGNKPLPE